jgi:hypothetical protein
MKTTANMILPVNQLGRCADCEIVSIYVKCSSCGKKNSLLTEEQVAAYVKHGHAAFDKIV